MSIKPSELSDSIKNDEQLAKKRNLLVIISLLVMAFIMSGAKITEANTFIFKITFSNSDGLKSLLLLANGFLLVRYHSYAHIYINEIKKGWTESVLSHRFFYLRCEHSDGEAGYLVDIAPDFAGYNDDEHRYSKHANSSVSLTTQFWVLPVIDFDLYNEHGYVNHQTVSLIQFKKPIKSILAILIIVKIWWQAQIRYRESLDIYSPYLIAFVGIFMACISAF